MLEADPWRGRHIDGSQLTDKLIAAESARGLKTYRASLDAALGGFGPQAAMLNRVLFEGMATACWASANPQLAAERFNQHQRHNRALWSERLIASGVIDEPLTDLPGAGEQRELDGLFGTWGDRLWCGLPMHKLIDAIEDQWEEGVRLRGFFAIAHATNNEAQHATATALLRPVISKTLGNLQVDAGPSLQGVDQALHGALWSYGHLLRATAEYFEIDGREEIMPLFKRCESTFVRLDLDLEKGIGPNDPCPCGSGKRFRHCHGA
jgi:SEC-C motif